MTSRLTKAVREALALDYESMSGRAFTAIARDIREGRCDESAAMRWAMMGAKAAVKLAADLARSRYEIDEYDIEDLAEDRT